MTLTGRNALVVGYGKSGAAAARLLVREGAKVTVADAKRVDAGGLPVVPLDARAFEGRELVVLSPGVPRSLVQGDAELIGEVELASRFIEEPLAGITGTNGKSTTTALAGHLLQTAGLDVFVGGNLGTPLSERVLAGGARAVSVVELSSFQLESIVQLRCAAATVLNVTPDHLDRYASLEDYAAAKARIFANQKPGDLAALNVSDARVAAMRTPSGVQRAPFNPLLDAAGDLDGARIGKTTLRVRGTQYELRAKTLRGAHNAENALAALLLAGHFGASAEALQRGLDTYPGLAHRLEPVAVQNGVEWINDSKATNVDSVERALAAFDGPLLVIMGGRGKGAPYAPLRRWFKNVKALLTIGEDAQRIADELGDLAPVHACGELQRAVIEARKLAVAGDTVLLSPACASYDQFKNFEHRGDVFKSLVREAA